MPMKQKERRTCDRCGREIPPGVLHRRFHCKPGVAEMLLGGCSPVREANRFNGTICIAVCLECATGRASCDSESRPERHGDARKISGVGHISGGEDLSAPLEHYLQQPLNERV